MELISIILLCHCRFIVSYIYFFQINSSSVIKTNHDFLNILRKISSKFTNFVELLLNIEIDIKTKFDEETKNGINGNRKK